MSSKKEILNSLSHLKDGNLEEVEFPYAPAFNQKLYYYARKLGLNVTVEMKRNRWVVSPKEDKKPVVGMRTKELNTDILYSAATLIKHELLTIILFEGASEADFKALDPVAEIFVGVNIEFSSRGMELSLKSEEDKEQEEMYERED